MGYWATNTGEGSNGFSSGNWVDIGGFWAVLRPSIATPLDYLTGGDISYDDTQNGINYRVYPVARASIHSITRSVSIDLSGDRWTGSYCVDVYIYFHGTRNWPGWNPDHRALRMGSVLIVFTDTVYIPDTLAFTTMSKTLPLLFKTSVISLGGTHHGVSFNMNDADFPAASPGFNIKIRYGSGTDSSSWTSGSIAMTSASYTFPGITTVSGGYSHVQLQFSWDPSSPTVSTYSSSGITKYAVNDASKLSIIPAKAEALKIATMLKLPSRCSVIVPSGINYTIYGLINNFYVDNNNFFKSNNPQFDDSKLSPLYYILRAYNPPVFQGTRVNQSVYFIGNHDLAILAAAVTDGFEKAGQGTGFNFKMQLLSNITTTTGIIETDAWFWRRYTDLDDVRSFSTLELTTKAYSDYYSNGNNIGAIDITINGGFLSGGLGALIEGPVNNQRTIAYKIQYLGTNPSSTTPITTNKWVVINNPAQFGKSAERLGFAYMFQKNFTKFFTPLIDCYCIGVDLSQPLHKFNVTIIYDTMAGHSLYQQFNNGKGNSIPTTVRKSFIFYYDTRSQFASGSFGTVFFESSNLVIDNKRALSTDGLFTVQVGVGGISLENGFMVTVLKDGSIFRQFGKDFAGGPLFTISPVDIFDVDGNDVIDPAEMPAPATYSLSICPYTYPPGQTDWLYANLAKFDFHDKLFGIAGASHAKDIDDFSITYVDFKDVMLEFTPDGTSEPIAGASYTSYTGIYEARPRGYSSAMNQYLVNGQEVVLDQLEGGSLVNQVTGFTDFRGAFKLFDKGFSYVRGYESAGTSIFQFQALKADKDAHEAPAGITQFRGIRDGSYTLRARYNYRGFGLSSSIIDSTFTIQSARSLLIDGDPSSSTTYSGNFELKWDAIGPERSYLLSDSIDMSSIFYVIIYGNADSVDIMDFTGDLGALPPGIHVLQSNNTGYLDATTWDAHMFSRYDTRVKINGKEGWGHDDAPDFTGDAGTYHFAVIPFYKVRSIIGGVANKPDLWYHGDISNVVTLTINRQVRLSLKANPSEIVADTLKIYSHDQVSFEAIGIAAGGAQYADNANITVNLYTDSDRAFVASTYFSLMVSAGSGKFELQKNVFSDIGIKNQIEYASIIVQFDFTTSGIGRGVTYAFFKVVIDTAIRIYTDVISPSFGEALHPTTGTSGTVIFSARALNDPYLAIRIGLPDFQVSDADQSIKSVLLRGYGDLSSYGTILHIAGTFNWQMTLDNILDISTGTLHVDVVVTITIGLAIIDVPFTIDVEIKHDPSIVVTSPVLTGNAITINGYQPITVKLLSYFGSSILPDNVQLDVRKNGAQLFSGTLAPTFYYYQYMINPLDHADGDVFRFSVTAISGDKAGANYVFTITIQFKIMITVKLSDFEYNTSRPAINGKIKAYVNVAYPTSYHLYYIETNKVITNRQDYTLVRNVGNIQTIFRPLNMGTSTQLVFDTTVSQPNAGDVDWIVFDIAGPTLVTHGFTFPTAYNGTVYVENLTLHSNNRFSEIVVSIPVSYKGFGSSSDERWAVYVNGNNVTFTAHVSVIAGTTQRDVTLTITVPSINPGQSVDISVKHYYASNAPEPPPSENKSVFDQIIAFLLSIITAILSLLGLAIARNKHVNGLNIASNI